MAKYLIEEETLRNLAEATRAVSETGEEMSTEEMVATLLATAQVLPNVVRTTEQMLTDEQKQKARENIGAASAEETDKNVPDYWQTHIEEKISLIKEKQDIGGKDSFSYIVITDIHYPSNLGKISPILAKCIMQKCNIKYVLILGDLRTRGVYDTKEICETEWNNIDEMLKPLFGNILITQGNHDAGYGKGDYDTDGDLDNYAYEFTPAEMYNRIYRKVEMTGDAHFDASGTAYYIDDTANKVRYIMLNTQLNFDGNKGYGSYETVNGMAKYPSMWKFRYTQCQYDFLINDALTTVPSDDWKVVMGSHVPINQTGEMPEFQVMIGVLQAFNNKTTYSGNYEGTAVGESMQGYTNLAEPLDNTTDTEKWVNEHRISSSGVSSQTGKTVCNKIPCTKGDVIRVKGVEFVSSADRVALTNANGAYFCIQYVSGLSTSVDYDYEYVDGVHKFTVLNEGATSFRCSFDTPADPSSIIITKNEEISESANTAPGYDYVNVQCDFTDAKGELVAYHGGHNHKDDASFTCYKGGTIQFPIITTRCDGKQENDDLKNERIAGTVTEQSFDVFTVTPNKIYATKIGAGSDREISI